jgi:hypothetical protein
MLQALDSPPSTCKGFEIYQSIELLALRHLSVQAKYKTPYTRHGRGRKAFLSSCIEARRRIRSILDVVLTLQACFSKSKATIKIWGGV